MENLWTVEEDVVLRLLVYLEMGDQNSKKLTYDQIAAAMAEEASKRRISSCNREHTATNINSHWAQLKYPISYPLGWQQSHVPDDAPTAKDLNTEPTAASPETGINETRRFLNMNCWTAKEDELLRSIMYKEMCCQNEKYLTYDQVATTMNAEACNRRISNCNRVYTGFILKHRRARLRTGSAMAAIDAVIPEGDLYMP